MLHTFGGPRRDNGGDHHIASRLYAVGQMVEKIQSPLTLFDVGKDESIVNGLCSVSNTSTEISYVYLVSFCVPSFVFRRSWTRVQGCEMTQICSNPIYRIPHKGLIEKVLH